jgi:hypothetical protein
MNRSNARISRDRLWVLTMALLLLVLALPGDVGAQVSSPAAGDDRTYVDPEKRFQIPIPTNWAAEEQDGYVRIVTSDGKIVISAAIVAAPGATRGIDTFLRNIDPEFENPALAELLATPTSETDDSALYTFDDGAESGQLLQALGRKVGDDVFVLVLQGELEAVKLRQVQVDKIFAGILIRAESDASPVASPAA